MKEINIGQAAALTSPDPLVLVCTQKADGTVNLAPVSFVMYASFNPPMLAFAMMKPSSSGENFRRTGRAVVAVPGAGLNDAVMAYGAASGRTVDKLKETPIPMQSAAGIDIPFPEDSRVAFAVTLAQTVEAGDHNLYLCRVEKVLADDTRPALFAWDGYAKATPAKEA